MFEKYLDKENLIKSIAESVSIPSVVSEPEEGMPYGRESADALKNALDLAESMGFKTFNADNVYGYAEYGDGDEMIAILGHVDVVPGGDGWTGDPFKAEIRDGRIYGRGTSDDKGPIIAALYALKSVVDSGTELKRRVRIIFGGGEEVGAQDMVIYAENEELPVMGFTPDGYYPVIYGEKGMLQLKLSKRICCRAEGDAGIMVNQVPDSSVVSFYDDDGNLHEYAGTGKSAHGSRPFDGINAIDDMFKKVESAPEELEEIKAWYERYLMGDCYGTRMGIDSDNAEFGRNTLNVGLFHASDMGDGTSLVSFGLDYRTNPDLPLDEAVERIRSIAEQNGFSMEITARLDTLYIPRDNPLVSILTEIYRENTGTDAEPLCIGGGTYAKRIPNMVAFGAIYPEDEDRMHQADEYIAMDRLLLTAEMMAQAMVRLANA